MNQFREIVYSHLFDALKNGIANVDAFPIPNVSDQELRNKYIGFENEKFEPASNAVSVFIKCQHRQTEQVGFGGEGGENGIWEARGFVFCEIRTPLNKNMGEADLVSQVLHDALFYKRIDGVKFEDVNASEDGQIEDYNRVTVSARFEYDISRQRVK